MTAVEIAGLASAAAAAGAMNAVAGGGTLVTFPVLLFFGTPAVIANATSTLALTVGTAGSVFGYRRHLAEVKTWLWRFLPVSVIGGLLGAELLMLTGNGTFSRLVPFLILFATLLFLAQGVLRRLFGLQDKEGRENTEHTVWAAIGFQFGVAIYGGYFGAGIGILMLAMLGFMGMRNIHEMNTIKTIQNTLINFAASILFLFHHTIDWPKASVMIAGSIVGYFLGSHYSQRIPQMRVRQIVLVIGFTCAAWTFYKQFLS
jgi:uncharacterized membrane protein YfcA